MVFDVKRGTITIPASDTVVAGTTTEVLHGQLGLLYISVPALEGTGTATILGTQSLGGTVFASTAIAEGVLGRVAPAGTPTFFSGTLYLSASAANVTDGTQSAARNITYDLYYATKQG